MLVSRRAVCWLAWAMLLCATQSVFAARDYALEPQQVAPNTYVLIGANEHFSFANGGNIANTGFIVTDDGVVVIDTGPSRLYGEQMIAAIRAITEKPVVRVYNTHLHPDHFLGNQAFDASVLAALPATIDGIRRDGDGFNENMYRLCGPWEAGTHVVAPAIATADGVERIGGHRLRLLAMTGHSDGDLVVFDETTGVLFAGDLVFNGRTPTTPHAEIVQWLASLDALDTLPFKVLVSGHGAVASDRSPIDLTRRYLVWLEATLAESAEKGLDMAEVLSVVVPPADLASLDVFASEFERSVAHLYPAYESAALRKGQVEQVLE
ncbi:quinoprotein relay system zinc metallohydrolase 1 [Thiosocius teredinicola]|uniref:quinoprotein relay system zinc metallohydrolase 1 n=1 Tax=Thiosocius teredinicola TaxID=1973002 RepID=UPI002FE4882F